MSDGASRFGESGSSSRELRVIAVGLAASAILLLRSPTNVPTVLASLGGLIYILGVLRGQRIEADVGVGVLLVAVAAAGLAGVPAWRVLAATVAVVIGWDLARYGIQLSAQLGADADTRRLELLRLAHTVGIGAVGGAILYAGFLASAGTTSLPAVTLLFLGVVAVAAALR